MRSIEDRDSVYIILKHEGKYKCEVVAATTTHEIAERLIHSYKENALYNTSFEIAHAHLFRWAFHR